MRSINAAWSRTRALGHAWPQECFASMKHAMQILRCWIQGDNTVKELRHGYTGKWAAMMVQSGFFKVVSHHHMVVGHTHEDIDGCFSLVTAALRSEPSLETPGDVCKCLDSSNSPCHSAEVFGEEAGPFVLEEQPRVQD